MPYRLAQVIVIARSSAPVVVGPSRFDRDGVGFEIQPFRINGLELVDLIFTSWNPLRSWLRGIDALRAAAY